MKRDLKAKGRLPGGSPRLYNVEEGPADFEGLNLADAPLPLSGWHLMLTLRGLRGLERPLQEPGAPAGDLPSAGTGFLGQRPVTNCCAGRRPTNVPHFSSSWDAPCGDNCCPGQCQYELR